MAAQLSSMKGRSRRGERAWTAPAISSLPVPLSPAMKTRHFVGAFHGVPGARAFRRHLATEGVKPGADAHTFRAALALVVDIDARMAHTAAA